jgi:hypothetical protein
MHKMKIEMDVTDSLLQAAEEALSFLRCEKEFPEDLTIVRIGNVVRYERVVSHLEQAILLAKKYRS